jgi:hypothetical protein
VVYSLFCIPPKNLGGPGSSRGTLEHIRADLTVWWLRFYVYLKGVNQTQGAQHKSVSEIFSEESKEM